MKFGRLLAIALVASQTACATARVNSDWDRNASFASYRTYAWVDTPGMEAMNRATLFDRRLRASMDAELATKGLSKAQDEGKADLLIVYHAGMQEKLDVTNSGYFGQRTDVRQFKEGTLVIDLVEQKSMSLVWRGTIVTEMNGPDQSGEKLDKAVKKMFEKYPTT